jgi:DNA-binding transcriptional ArsR family regulator
MTAEPELETVVELLDDEYAREILAATSAEPLSAEELAERCDASPPTVYRRLDRLREHDLVTAQQQLDPDGHHYDVFGAQLARVTVDLEDGEYRIDIERREADAADRFTELFEGLK